MAGRPGLQPSRLRSHLKLSQVGDLPPTWDEWWENFKASEAEQRRQGFPAIRVSVHAGKFKAWLQENSISSSEQTRQQFAQQRLEMKRERKAARLAAELPFGERLWAPAPPPPPAPWSHRAIEMCASTLLAIAISFAAVVGATLATSTGVLYHQDKATDGVVCHYFTGIGTFTTPSYSATGCQRFIHKGS